MQYPSHAHPMSWFFRIIQTEADEWECRIGRSDIDRHANLAEAVDHASQLAARERPSQLIVHPLGERATAIARFD
jgi:Uncharacterized protein conserved in bacteria (DUF2188)